MVRRVFVDDLSDVDYNNFGVHFSEDNYYRHTGGGSNGTTRKKRYEVSVYVDIADINVEATALSREEYPHEKEVVLSFNQALKALVKIVDTETGYFVGSHYGEFKTINTGTRCDKWAK